MKKTILATLALVALVSCSKENTETTIIDPTAPVAATFTSAAITRVTDSDWDTDDKIGITMVWHENTDLATGNYENVPYTVKEEGTSGTFSADDKVIYFPVDTSTPVDFIAYYPYTADANVDDDKNIEISVADQSYAHIDLVAAKAVSKTKASSTVTFSSTEAFSHQLSKLTMNIVAGDGIDALTDIKATIKGHYTTAKYNIYTSAVVAVETADITALTTSVIDAVAATEGDGTTEATPATPAKATIEAILIPTSEITGSTIEFTVGGNTYYLKTDAFVFTKGCEHTYTINLTRTGATISGATINGWGNGTEASDGVLDASDSK